MANLKHDKITNVYSLDGKQISQTEFVKTWTSKLKKYKAKLITDEPHLLEYEILT